MDETLKRQQHWLLAMAAIIATSGLVFELLAATVASWVLGDTVAQFSKVIGIYLGAMGIGSYMSRWFDKQLPTRFVQIELAIAVVGGSMVALLFALINQRVAFQGVLFGSVILVGILVGMEIPLLLRIIGEREDFRGGIAKILAFDHLGSLIGSLAFAFVLIPWLGVLRTSVVLGLCNAFVALTAARLFKTELLRPRTHLFGATIVLGALLAMYATAPQIVRRLEALS